MRCPYIKCAKWSKPILLSSIWSHLIKNQRHGMYRVWIGLGKGDESDEEWAITN
jgi:hypothetical protein